MIYCGCFVGFLICLFIVNMGTVVFQLGLHHPAKKYTWVHNFWICHLKKKKFLTLFILWMSLEHHLENNENKLFCYTSSHHTQTQTQWLLKSD